jgi:hypothetical protein
MLNLEIIRNRLGAGFKPFTLHLSDGRKIPVPHPDFVIVGRGVVVVLDEHDVDHVVDGMHIVSVEDRLIPENAS